jgi:hypothetical protein
MHHFIYPSQDAYISNKSSEIDKNFGLDELLTIGVSQSFSKTTNYTKTYSYSSYFVSAYSVENFTGKFTGSFYGSANYVSGTLAGGTNTFTVGFFAGDVSASIDGIESGVPITISDYSGSLYAFSGIISAYSVIGYVTGSIETSCFGSFTGDVSNVSGSLTGYITGQDVVNEQNVTVSSRKFLNRSLLKFDLTSVSQSISSGEIFQPEFRLKLKVTQAKELPVQYKIYAFPISQSWVQGDGYFSDDGSDEGVSWNWRNKNSGSFWYSPYTDETMTSSIDYLSDYSKSDESFKRGGGTWYNIPCTQSYSYESADIDLNVTPIVNSWLENTIPNEGFILMCSEETDPSGSNAHIFLFSRETNTIYSPVLDIGWDDTVWTTGSFGTGSINTITYPARLSGSMLSSSVITGISVSGSVNGNMYLITDSGNILTGSQANVYGNSGNIINLNSDGEITGSYIENDGFVSITASFSEGDFQGCLLLGTYSGSEFSGIMTGSFNGSLLHGYHLSANIPDNIHDSSVTAYQNSKASGNLLGKITSDSQFKGVVTNGLLKGASTVIDFTGSYAYLTSSLSVETVELTGSSFEPIDSNRPFIMIIQDMKTEYSFGDMPRINVFAREQYPLKTFGKTPQQLTYITPRLMPTSSYYAIKDNQTEEFILDFDNYTKISCDSTGHYFILNTTSLSVERYYKILL